MAPGIFSIALEPIPGVSFGPSALTSVIFPSLRVRVTVIESLPPKPSPLPVAVTIPLLAWAVVKTMRAIAKADTSTNTRFFIVA